VGYWTDKAELKRNWAMDKTWEPKMNAEQRLDAVSGWKKAVQRTFDWVD
jgi:glycerol kinase